MRVISHYQLSADSPMELGVCMCRAEYHDQASRRPTDYLKSTVCVAQVYCTYDCQLILLPDQVVIRLPRLYRRSARMKELEVAVLHKLPVASHFRLSLSRYPL